MSAPPSDPTLGTTSTIGRYFGIVSVVPSLLFVVWAYLLLSVHPWDGPPDVSEAMDRSPVESVVVGALLMVSAIALAAVTHPLQFLAVQLLEGYWGTGPLALALQERRILSHLRRRRRLESIVDSAPSELRRISTGFGKKSHTQVDWVGALDRDQLRPLLAVLLAEQRSKARIGQYPKRHANMMPTRLGNTLRKYEESAGGAVGLDIVAWANHIGMVAEPTHTAYVQDQRNGLDLAVRMTVHCSAMFALTFALLWPHGLWLGVALLPLAGAWLSYRGAVVAADGYGRAFAAWLHLNRFRLYDALRLPAVMDSEQERTQNKGLRALILGQPEFTTDYLTIHES